jgi:hypothetical protein
VCHKRFDFVKYAILREGNARDDAEEVTGRLLLCFRLKHDRKVGHYAFVRRLKHAPRDANTHFARMEVEKAINAGGVRSPAAPRLGQLWTWATVTSVGSESQGREDARYEVVPAESLHTTVCMMPKWRRESADWDVSTGVWENPYLLESRVRPPFRKCTCMSTNTTDPSSSDEEDMDE